MGLQSDAHKVDLITCRVSTFCSFDEETELRLLLGCRRIQTTDVVVSSEGVQDLGGVPRSHSSKFTRSRIFTYRVLFVVVRENVFVFAFSLILSIFMRLLTSEGGCSETQKTWARNRPQPEKDVSQVTCVV